ncbi:helix-turn-helix domain-containing protein [Sandarakinorhabdus rubra]|uniref:helix-turn-helix domain-containing protein n=1 Tax=Sandarakinorhabdus rubra TaxID=2672568 RepID=UPI0013D95E82|nr:AraC family transcriptional regulator [Sandarakinorhabdus rubra]
MAIVGSDTRHSFRANGAVAFLFVAPESLVGQALRAALPADAPWAQLHDGPLAAAADELRSCLERGCPRPEMLALGRRLLAQLPAAASLAPTDSRVLRMIDFARHNLEDRLSLPAAAAAVHLSTSRARHLFVEATGLPFKTYVLWLRLERAVALYADGRSLTEAAHEAGFADSAHFSRTFRRTFGLPAAGLRLYRE